MKRAIKILFTKEMMIIWRVPYDFNKKNKI